MLLLRTNHEKKCRESATFPGFSGISASTESRDTSGEDDSDDDVNGDVDRDRERIRNNFTKHKSVSAKDVEHTN